MVWWCQPQHDILHDTPHRDVVPTVVGRDTVLTWTLNMHQGGSSSDRSSCGWPHETTPRILNWTTLISTRKLASGALLLQSFSVHVTPGWCRSPCDDGRKHTHHWKEAWLSSQGSMTSISGKHGQHWKGSMSAIDLVVSGIVISLDAYVISLDAYCRFFGSNSIFGFKPM